MEGSTPTANILPYPGIPYLGAANPGQNVLPELPRALWLEHMARVWSQGEHVALCGRTGRGKTTLARDLLTIRRWVIALAVKRDDDTLGTFASAGYRKLKRWPPEYNDEHVLYWPRPKNLDDVGLQSREVGKVLDYVFTNGGWALLLDDLAYVVNVLGYRRWVTIMYNQARSSGVSMVACLTQPSSVAAAVPSETWRQVRFILAFRYHADRDAKVIADMMGYPLPTLRKWMDLLGGYDFLAYDNDTDEVMLVRS